MVLTRKWSIFLVLVGVWNWVIWPRFAKAIWDDPRSFVNDSPTNFLWIHALLIVSALVIGTVIGALGIRGWLATRRRS